MDGMDEKHDTFHAGYVRIFVIMRKYDDWISVQISGHENIILQYKVIWFFKQLLNH